ncbi:beta strand repeat-containing protein [Caballeronia sp. M23-90]
MSLTSTNGYSQTLPYDLLTYTKPTGLIDGSTNFYSGGTATTLQPVNTYGQAVDAWQGRTFIGLSAGTYTFTYVPIANPTQVWAPTNASILSNTVTIITADLNNTAPRLTTGTVVDQTQVSDPIIFEGGTVRPTADSSLGNIVSIDNPGGTVDTAGHNLTLSGAIDGRGVLTKTGDGTLSLTGSNTSIGGVALNGGAVNIASDANLGATSGGLTFDGGTLQLGSSFDLAPTRSITLNASGGTIDTQQYNTNVAQGITGTGGLTKAGTGVLTLSGANTYTGATTVAQGTLQAGANNALSQQSAVTVAQGADLNLNGFSQTVGSLAGAGTVDLGSATLAAGANGTSTVFSGAINGSGGLVKQGAGTLALSGTNTYSGGTSVNGGTLEVYSDANLGDASGALTLNGSTLHTTGDVTGTRNIALAGNGTINTDAGTAMTNSGTVSGTGGLIKNGTGTLELDGVASHQGGTTVNGGTLVLGGANTYTGGTTLNGGSLHISSDANLGDSASAIHFHGGDLTVTSSMSTARNVDIGAEGASLTTLNGVTLVEQGNLTGIGGLQKNGDGTLVVSGNNTFSGGTLINGGAVQIDSGSSLGTGAIVLNGGTLNTVASLGTGQQVLISGASGVNVAAGTTAMLSGQLVASADSSCFTKSGKGALNMTGAATLPNGTCVADGTLLANGALNSNVQVFDQGTLRGVGVINGPISVNGKLAPGDSTGTLIVNGTVTMNNGSAFEENIDGLGTATGAGNYSRVLVQGAGNQFIANGTLQPTLRGIAGNASNTYTPSIGDTFRIVTADGGIVGRFNGIAQPTDGLLAGTRLQAFYNMDGSNSIDLRVTPQSYASSFNASNANVRGLGNLLDRGMVAQDNGTTTDRQSQLMYAVAAANSSQLNAVAKGLAGEVHADMAAAAPEAARAAQSQITDHLGSGPAADLGRSEMLWANVSHNNDHTSSDGYATGFTARSNQVTVGADVVRSGTTRLGLGFSHADTDVSTDGGGGSIQENLGFLYGQHAAGRLLVDGIFGYGAQSWTTTRADVLGLAGNLGSGNHGHDIIASLGARLPVEFAGHRLEPFVRAVYQHEQRDGANEGTTSVSALSLSDYSASGTRFLAGLSGGSLSQDPLTQLFTYKFSAAVGTDTGSLIRTSVDSELAGQTMTIQSPHSGRQFGQLNLGGTVRVAKLGYLFVGAQTEIAARRTAYSLTGGVRIGF